MHRVLITNRPPADHLRPLSDHCELLFGPDDGSLMPREQVLELAPRLSAIINQAELRVDAELLGRAPRLRIVANASIGTDNLDTQRMAYRGVWATNVPDAFVDACADCAIGMLLALARKLPQADAYVRSGAWPNDGFQPGVWDGMELRDKTLGVVGFGRIGRAVAQRAQAFGMAIVWHDAHRADGPGYLPLDDLLARADAVSLHVPLTEQTHHLINRRKLKLIKPTAILMNFARGQVVDEAALVDALANDRIGGAVLDVYENEPHVSQALLDRPDVVLAPHIGGGTRESRKRARLLCAHNVAEVLSGRRPQTPVNQPARPARQADQP